MRGHLDELESFEIFNPAWRAPSAHHHVLTLCGLGLECLNEGRDRQPYQNGTQYGEQVDHPR